MRTVFKMGRRPNPPGAFVSSRGNEEKDCISCTLFRSISKKRTVWLAVLFLLSAAGLFADTWYNEYEAARAALKDGKWDTAVTHFRAALEEKPEPKLNAKTVGLRFIDYLPYYYLGSAYHGGGRFKEALAAFNKSLEFGVIQRKKTLHIRLQQRLTECRPATEEKVKAAVPPTPGEAKSIPPPEDKAATEPAGKERERQPEPAVEKAAEKPTVSAPEPVKTDPAPKPPAVKQPTVSAAVPANAGLVNGVKVLNEGIRLYFEGDRTGAETRLKNALHRLPEGSVSREARAAAYAFLAVQLIERYFLDGGEPGELLTEARRFITEIKKIDPAFELDKDYFSPKVVKFFTVYDESK